MSTLLRTGVALSVLLLGGCPSQWKVHGGPAECMSMCQEWDMELAGMVGVGDQGRTGGGASACVCTVPTATASTGGHGSAGTTASLSAAVVALEASQNEQQAQQQ